LFNVRALVQAEVLDNALEQAAELLRAGYKDPACVVAGVTLETALKELCTRQGVAHGKLDKMNADLCKAGVYNMGWQKQITAWAERRNKAAHGDWAVYNNADVDDMIKGVTRFIAEYL
jgi:HEPN domain-containing protein